MAKFDIKTVKPKFVVTTSPENKIDVVVNKPIIETKLSKSFFKLKNMLRLRLFAKNAAKLLLFLHMCKFFCNFAHNFYKKGEICVILTNLASNL